MLFRPSLVLFVLRRLTLIIFRFVCEVPPFRPTGEGPEALVFRVLPTLFFPSSSA